MMKLKFSFLIAACAIFVAGCSSVPTQVDKGSVRGSTYSLMASTAPAGTYSSANRQEVQKEIQNAISKALAEKGLKQVANGGDVQVGYLVLIGDNASTLTYDEYFGYGRDAAALSEKAHKALSKKTSRDQFEVGALVIDVVDPKDSKLLYRSYVVTDIKDMTPGTRAERIDRLVASCLGRLKVGG
jgi:hypothetical protein